MTDNYDQLALSWVRKEINNTLDQARQGLENFAEDSQDQTQIQFCINCLHQVQGTLQMLEFEGAARLAKEMENLADKMANDPAYAVESSFEVLMRALLQMPGYLERVEEGQKDIPVVLLPLINELRRSSGLPEVAESEVFSALNYNVAPPKAVEQVSEQDKTTSFQDNSKKLRTHFQKGLTGVIRGQGVKEALSRIHKVLLRLEALTEGRSVARLWWVADGFIFSIAEGGQYKKKEVHVLLSQVDKQIKRLSDEGAGAMDDVIPEQLLSQLLYYVARSSSKNSRVQALKKEFDLEASLADSQEIKQRQMKMTRPDKSAVTNVVGAINEELATVKDQLDLFVRAQAKDASALHSLVESLVRISDTLTLLELAIPRDVIRQQIKSIQRILDLEQMPDDSMVMDVAGALLFVEANLKNVNLDRATETTDESESNERSQAQAKESQVDEATKALIKVSRKSMQAAKDKMINYIASGFDREALADVPALLEEVLGGVRIVKFEQAADILTTAQRYVDERIISVRQQPEEEYLDALADVITSVEYYLEASEEGSSRGVESILRGAENSVALLEKSLAEELPATPVAEPEASVEETPEFVLDTSVTQAEESESEPELAAEPEADAAEVVPILTSSADKEIDETLIDEEVLEIFLEEAEEEIETINTRAPRWIENHDDEESLTTIRRSFHTLKGSGRLVGAKTIGEVAWAVENMLNKVIEETIPAERPVLSILQEAHMMLPKLVAAFANKEACSENYPELIARAEHIAAGKPLSEFEFQGAAEQQTVAGPASAPEEAIDPVLLEIFSAEADGHLQTIADYLASAPAEGTVAVTDELIRALHTLKGSANMAGVEQISGLTGPLEKYARLVKGSHQRFDQQVVDVLRDIHAYLATSLQQLKAGESADVAQAQSLAQRVEALAVPQMGDAAASASQRDQHFVSIFLTEGLDILHEVSKLNQALANDRNNTSVKDSIREELKAFHHGAEMLSLPKLQSLSEATQRLADFGCNRELNDDQFNLLLTQALDGLEDMLNRIASEEDLDSADNTISAIDNWIESTGADAVPEDMDVELVELFVEEGEELVESARELLVRWAENQDSKEINAELRRIYHTLKGSSRMAGAMNIGDLAYAAEDMFNSVLDFGREQSQRDVEIINHTTDKLESMVAVLKTLTWPQPAEPDIKIIRDYLDGKDAQEDELEAEAESQAAPVVTETEEVIESHDTEAEEIPTVMEMPDEGMELEIDTLPAESSEPESVEFEIGELPVEDAEASLEFTVAEETAEDIETEAFETGTGIETDWGTSEVVDSEDDIPVLVEEAEEFIADELADSAQIAQEDEAELVAADSEDSEQETAEVTDAIEEETSWQVESFETEVNSETEVSSEAEDAADAYSEALELADESSDSDSVVEFSMPEDSEASEELSVEEEPALAEEETTAEITDEEQPELVYRAREKDSSTEVVTEDTISPSAPLVATGSVYKVDLDEDGEEVLEIYLEEAEELLEALDQAVHDWSESLDNKNAIDLLQRTLHTFKGGARLSDLLVLGDVAHEMETYFEKVNAGTLQAKAADVDVILQGYDAIEKLVNEVKDERQMTRPENFMLMLEALIKGESPASVVEEDISEMLEPSETDTAEPEEVATQAEEPVKADIVSFEKKKQQKEDTKQKAAAPTEFVRVPSDQLEGLVNLAGETSIFRSRLEQQMSVLRYNLEEMNQTVERLREQLRNLDIETDAQISYRREISGGLEYEDFDPLEMDRYTRQQELTRGLGESAVDLVSLKESIDSLTADSETLLLQQGRVNTEMQESLMRTRMIPFESLVPRLRRMVRQISTELGKTIELSISADGEMDRTVLERMVAPLEHMLRNAMDHGIESPSERKGKNKAETGSVKISMFREGSEVFIKLQDDGRGLKLQAIRKKAIEKGLITSSSELTDHELQQLILEAGFSTAEHVTQISGRGVGMDVVSSEIKQLGGVIEINSRQDVGTTFTIKLPFTMSVNQALMVQLGDEVFAIPLSNIEGIVRVSPFELEEYYANPEAPFGYAGIDYSMYYLGQMLDHQRTANLQGVNHPLPVLLLHGADHPTALQVDDLLGSREIVVKSLGSQLSSVSGLSGATILGDGRVVLILDMPALIRRVDATSIEEAAEVVEVEEEKVPTVMVVDDSITVRKVTTRLLERHDFEVITAKDGVDALSVLGEQKPDVMLLDIEMPRMDGFELATIIRHDEALKDLPIIMITSRTGEKHRERAEQIGVNQYMGKPYNEVDLLESISSLLPNKS